MRFAFISTYEETVALKISKQSNGKYALYYSERIPHSQVVVDHGTDGVLSKVSVRLVMLYLIYRASHGDGTSSLDPSQIPTKSWTADKASGLSGVPAEISDSPFIENWNLETSTPKANIGPRATFATATPDGTTPDDTRDQNYVDMFDNDDTPSKPRTRPHNLRSTSNHEHASETGEATEALSRLGIRDER